MPARPCLSLPFTRSEAPSGAQTGFQSTWVGAAYFWCFAATYAGSRSLESRAWRSWAWFNGMVGVVTMVAAVFLAVYSLWLYIVRYGRVIIR